VVESPKEGRFSVIWCDIRLEADDSSKATLLRPDAKRFSGNDRGLWLYTDFATQPSMRSRMLRSGVVEIQNLAIHLCELGFVVFCRAVICGRSAEYNIDVKTTVEPVSQTGIPDIGMHKMLFDTQRAVDILVSRDEVDPNRIGTVGHSLGAKEVL